jgi:hypothetical protein
VLRCWRRGCDQARLPSWGAATGRGTDRLGGEPTGGEQPGDHRVGVPHLAHPQLVSAPHRRRQAANQRQEATGHRRVVAEQLRTGHGLTGVGDGSIRPAADLVAEHPPAAQVAAAHRTLHEHAAGWAIGVGDGPAVLDHKSTLRDPHDQGGVVQVERPPVLKAGVDDLPDAPIEAHEPTAGAQGEPVQLDAGLGGRWSEPWFGGIGRSQLGGGLGGHGRLGSVAPDGHQHGGWWPRTLTCALR